MPTDRPRAWIFDVDGTLALIGDRSPYDMRNVAIDTPNHPVVVAAQAFAAHPDVDALIVVSGRDETARRATEAWLTFNEIPFDRLLLRRTGDQRADNIVKGEIYDAHIEPHFTVIGVVDDRRSVVEMWRSRGLTCFQVAEGDFLIAPPPRAAARLSWGHPRRRGAPMGKVVMYASVSVDGFIADENDQPGPLFDWLLSGDIPLDESGVLTVSQASFDYTRPYWDQVGATIVGRHVFDLTDGWDGVPPGGVDHVVVVTHRPAPEGWNPEAPFHFVDNIEAAVATAQELAGDGIVEASAGDVGGQLFAAGLIDEVRMDVAPVVFGTGKRYFGPVDAPQLLQDPVDVIQGDRVLHLRYQVKR